jgi:hypothetical protein
MGRHTVVAPSFFAKYPVGEMHVTRKLCTILSGVALALGALAAWTVLPHATQKLYVPAL